MKTNSTAIYIAFAILTGSLLGYFILNREKEVRYSWFESYSAASDQPYGTLYLKNLLSDYRPGEKFTFSDKKPVADVLPGNQDVVTDYIFVGNSFYLSSSDRVALLKFVGNGNDAFIASAELPIDLIAAVFDDTCELAMKYHDVRSQFVTMNFFHDSLRLAKNVSFGMRFMDRDIEYQWTVLDPSDSCGVARIITPLGFQQPGGVNFFKVSYAKGAFYFHTDPLAFTNYFLAKRDHLSYTEGVLSHLKGKDILWDEFSRLPEQQQKQKGKSSPLYYILQQPSLKYAWWLLLITVVLYVSFAAKRKQRVIPVSEQKVNTSLEFVNLIAALHHQHGNPVDMAKKKMKYFLYFVRSKYGIQAQTFGPEHVALLAIKSNVPIEEVKIIFDRYGAIETNSYFSSQSDKLLELFYSIESFTSKCR